MMANPRLKSDCTVAVVIPAFGASPHLKAVLEALERQTTPPDQIVVSHSSTDDPTGWMVRAFPNVQVVHSPQRRFAGAARNAGVALTESEFVAFCDCDCIPAENWLKELITAISVEPARLAVGSVGIASGGGYWGMANWLCEFSEMAPWRKGGEQTGGASCNMIVKRTDFNRVGGFESERYIGEDTLLFHSLRRAGLKQMFVPEAAVYHHNNSGFKAFVAHQFEHGVFFSRLRKDVKLPGSSVVRIPPMALLLFLPKLWRVLSRMSQDEHGSIRRMLKYGPGVLIGSLIFALGSVWESLRPRDT